MGAISALIVGPCVAAPLAGALIYLSQSRDVVVGGAALFAMAMGMSVPLLMLGVSAGSLLPRAGKWMEAVKRLFGVLMLAVALWMVSPVLPAVLQMAAWSALLMGYGFYLLRGSRPWSANAFGAVLAVLAQSKGKTALLDFYADWCVSCKEMEKLTFVVPKVKAKLADTLLLQVDVTANDEADKAMLKRFSLFGPPGIILFDKTGAEIPDSRVIGFQDADKFAASLAKLN